MRLNLESCRFLLPRLFAYSPVFLIYYPFNIFCGVLAPLQPPSLQSPRSLSSHSLPCTPPSGQVFLVSKHLALLFVRAIFPNTDIRSQLQPHRFTEHTTPNGRGYIDARVIIQVISFVNNGNIQLTHMHWTSVLILNPIFAAFQPPVYSYSNVVVPNGGLLDFTSVKVTSGIRACF